MQGRDGSIDASEKPVALISMPILSAELPSIQLAILKPILRRAGIDVQTFSLYMYFGTHAGWRVNEALSNVRPCAAGEWIWAKAAFGDFAGGDRYIESQKDGLRAISKEAGCTVEEIVCLREKMVFTFLDFCLASIDWSRFGLIGFSVVFQQMCASLALARRLKERFPQIPIVLGGAAMEDDIAASIMKACLFIDAAHCGDAEETLPDMVRKLRRGESPDGLPGVMWRDGHSVRYAGRAPNCSDMDSVPVPDFDEFFYARRESGFSDHCDGRPPALPIETARGCWWGAKNQCTFCGLNRAGIEYRARSISNVVQTLDALSRRHGVHCFDAIDNIMPSEYVEGLFGKLAEIRSGLRIHYCVRPCYSRRQLGRLRSGGLVSVQPGVESFSTHVLGLMKKHITGVRNVGFVKWCTYYGINNLYNILYGFCGETAADYELQCRIIEKIPHFQPPYTIAQARADRGSPMFVHPDEFGIRGLRPCSCYEHIFPADRFDLRQVAYYFDHDLVSEAIMQGGGEIFRLVAEWQRRWGGGRRPFLLFRRLIDAMVIQDGRSARVHSSLYGSREADLYEFCGDPQPPAAIFERFPDDRNWITSTLAEWQEKGFMLLLDGHYLALALPVVDPP